MTLLFFIFLSHAAPACQNEAPKYLRDIKAIQKHLERHEHKKAVPPKVLAPVIYKFARKYNVNAQLITRVVLLESRGIPSAYNKHSRDCGIAQLHDSTIKLYGQSINQLCNAKNWKQNLELGVKILATTKRVCQYNLGPNYRKNLITCLQYEQKIASIK